MAYPFCPIIDDRNPFYCPDIPTADFLSHYRVDPNEGIDITQLSFYARISLSLEDTGFFGEKPNTFPATNIPPLQTAYQQNAFFLPGSDFGRENHAYIDSSLELDGPPRHARSNPTRSSSSFTLSAKADRLQFPSVVGLDSSFCENIFEVEESYVPFREPAYKLIHNDSLNLKRRSQRRASNRETSVEEQLFGPEIGDDTPEGRRSLVHSISSILPGLRIQQQLDTIGARSYQDIVDFLAKKGHLNPQVLTLFRRSNITRLELTESVCDEDGLNVAGKEVLGVMKEPHSFLLLSSISLSGTPLSDFDLTLLHHLPRLESLFLNSTQIGNEAIMHLVALKHTLLELDISVNQRITDDAFPSLCALSKLEYLGLRATMVSMDGIRKYVTHIANEMQHVKLDIPVGCMEYLRGLENHYIVQPTAPLIVDPTACIYLSNAALRRNLEAHACAASISSSDSECGGLGARAEMIQKLRTLLETRQSDLLVRGLVLGEPEGDNSEHLDTDLCF